MQKILKLPMFASLVLLVYMPFHIFLSQWLSTFTGGLDAWKLAKDIFLLLALITSISLVAYKRHFKDKYFWILLGGSLAYFLLHLLVWIANLDIDSGAALLGTAYNCRLFGYVLLGWSAFLLYPGKFPLKNVFKIVLGVSTVVAALGVLQYILPKDLLTHFGYSIERGVKPMFFIDDKPNLPRIMSTIRDPNSLGAYLILPITLLSLAFLKIKNARLLNSGLLMLSGLALLLTFSRSAWLGTGVSVAIILSWVYQKQFLGFIRKFWIPLLLAICLLLVTSYSLRDQYFVQNVIFHADESTQLTDPNDLRVDFAQKVSDQIIARPLGHGPGTAGLVSIQTNHVVLTENYFLQIAYEIGIQGLILFVTLMVFVIRLLLKRRDIYSKVLVASFVGITVSAMLLHTWSNEAVAATWCLLAGLTLGATKLKS